MVESAAVQRTVSRGIAEVGDAAGVVPPSGDASFDLLALVGAALPGGDAATAAEVAPAKTENDVPDSEIEGVLAALLAAGRLAEAGVNAVPPQSVAVDAAVEDAMTDEDGEDAAAAIMLATDEPASEDAALVAPEAFALAGPVPQAAARVETVSAEDASVPPESFIGPPAPRRPAEARIPAENGARAFEPVAPTSDLPVAASDLPVGPASAPLRTLESAVAPAPAEPHADDASAPRAPEPDDLAMQPAAPAVQQLPRGPVDAVAPDAPAVVPSAAPGVSAAVTNADTSGPLVATAEGATASHAAAEVPARAEERAETVRPAEVADDTAETPTAVAAAPAAVPQERPARTERRRGDTAAPGAITPNAADARSEVSAAPPAPAPAPGSDPFAVLREAEMKPGDEASEMPLPVTPTQHPELEAASGPRPESRSVFASEIVVPQAAAPRPAEPLPPAPVAQTAHQDHGPRAVDAPASAAPVMNRAAEMLMADLRNRAVERQILSAIRQGRDEARVTLYPPQLGQVVIRLAMDGQKVRVSMRATNEAAEETLQSGEAGLRDALGRQGFELSGFDVDSRNQEDGRRSPQRPYATPVVAARDESAGPFSIDVTA